MTDRGRSSAWWAFALVGLWGVGGFLWNVVVRGVGVWLALAVSAVIVVLMLLAMFIVRVRRPANRIPAPRRTPPLPRDIDIPHADAPALLEFANQVSNRIGEWMGPELDGEARIHAEQARVAIDNVVDAISDICADEQLATRVLPRMRSSMTVVKGVTDQKPNGAPGWFRLKDRIELQDKSLRNAVNAANNQNS